MTNTADRIAATLSSAFWLALLIGWVWLFARLFGAARTIQGEGMVSGGMVMGALWALVFYGIFAKACDMAFWLIDEWKEKAGAE